MRKIFVFVIFMALSIAGFTQTYFTSAGIRAGTELGLTVQQKLWKQGTLEGIITTNRSRWQLQGLVEYHRKFIGRRLNYYLGLGPHMGQEQGASQLYFGFTPITGIEITMVGLTFSWDYKPSFNLSGTDAYVFHDSGLSIRLVIIKERKKSLRERLGFDKKN